ncbi:hypothetical protein [Vogesella sp. LIG4]|uniref:hypothetical protein n=1 Tax=Vogesella sp. LIG4 TaxID=1192162 RepID=UPI00081F9A15|nr:hypothetical protein [Vogesella sp. LIG4]SCK07081.1 hypothetical protein PSELUDRAFT_0332 [Vogesella sp. LIG4]
MSTSFSYFEAEDRLLMIVQPGSHKLWLTRRLVQAIVRDVAAIFAKQVPGEGIPGAGSQAERIALEHQMAMNGEDLSPSDAGVSPLQFSNKAPPHASDSGTPLCTGLDAKAGKDYASIGFVIGDATLNIKLSRAGFHRLLRGVVMCGQQAGWMLQDVPPWLTQSLLGDLLGTLPTLDPEADGESEPDE